MKEIKLDLGNLRNDEELKPVAGMIVKSDLGFRLIVKNGKHYNAIALETMEVTDDDKHRPLLCLEEKSKPEVIGKLKLYRGL